MTIHDDEDKVAEVTDAPVTIIANEDDPASEDAPAELENEDPHSEDEAPADETEADPDRPAEG